MMEQDDILSRMDACRSEDLTDADADQMSQEFAAILQGNPQAQRDFDRIQAIDRRVADALDEIPIPAGLAGRILESLKTGSSASTATSVSDRGTPASADRIAPVSESVSAFAGPTVNRRRLRRRGLIATVFAVAAAISLTFWLQPGRTEYRQESISHAARELFLSGPIEGRLVDRFAPPKSLPFSSRVRLVPGTRWKDLPDFVGRKAVAYELTKGPLRAVLYVVKLAGKPRAPAIVTVDLPDAPQATSTGGLTTAIWQERGLLYVLVVEGNETEYQQFIASTPVVA